MKISYYPGCTLKTKARNLDKAAIASLEALGVEVEEIDRWNCCGAVHSLTADDLIHQLSALEEQDGGNGADAVLGGDRRIGVHIHLPDLETLGLVLLGQLLHDGGDHAARPAPRRPEVHHGETLV